MGRTCMTATAPREANRHHHQNAVSALRAQGVKRAKLMLRQLRRAR
jgi:hypothetical protein